VPGRGFLLVALESNDGVFYRLRKEKGFDGTSYLLIMEGRWRPYLEPIRGALPNTKYLTGSYFHSKKKKKRKRWRRSWRSAGSEG